MTEKTSLTPTLSVSGQIQPGDVAALAADGFQTLVNNRPDGEGEDQPTSEDIERAAQAAGLTYHYLPVTPGQITDSQVARFQEILEHSPQPVFAFCRTGNRSTQLWAGTTGR